MLRLIDTDRCPHHKPQPGMLLRAVGSGRDFDHRPIERLVATITTERDGTHYIVEAPTGCFWFVHHKDPILDGVHFAGRAVPDRPDARTPRS